MTIKWLVSTALCLLASDLVAQEADASTQQSSAQTERILGMNVRGNKESPLTLTIVPWRSAAHSQQDPEIRPGWQPQLSLLQPASYRRNINAFLISRKSRLAVRTQGDQNENQ